MSSLHFTVYVNDPRHPVAYLACDTCNQPLELDDRNNIGISLDSIVARAQSHACQPASQHGYRVTMMPPRQLHRSAPYQEKKNEE